MTEYTAPPGIGTAQIDPNSGQLATSECPTVRTEYFIEGTQPVETCSLHGGNGSRVAGWDTAAEDVSRMPPPGAPQVDGNPRPDGQAQTDPKKKGIFGKIKQIFR
ncbi:MAG: hypothetical protein JO022_05980 [Acidobacteriaceae bacterium]|nr:hypothetical protein [Acidobacteriaceae bacterium]